MKALIIGRWQPFHKGHMYLVRKALRDLDDVIIGVGSSGESRTDENPFTFEERRSIISSCFPDLEVIPVEDVGDDKDWIEFVEGKLVDLGLSDAKEEVVAVSMNEWTLRCFRKAGYRVKKYELLQPEEYDASSIRRLMKHGKEWKHLVPECSLKEINNLNINEILKG